MTCHLFALCFDANAPLRLARFWGGVLGWEMTGDPHDGIALLPGGGTGFRIRFLPTQEPKAGLNQLHAQQKFDAASIEDVLRGVGLDEVIARPAGRLDLAGRDGLLFAGSTGQACVYGEFGPDVTDVQLGSGIADGGCLPAPD